MSEMFCSSNSIGVYDNYNTLNHESPVKLNNNNASSKLWTLKLKPPTHKDAINFIEKLKNIRYNKQFQLKHNNVIDNIRKDLLSFSFTVGNDLNFFASENIIILEPLKQPPSYLMASKWLESHRSKYKRKKISIQYNKRQGFITPESISKSIMFKKINHSTPKCSQNKFNTFSPCLPMKRENKCLKSRRKLSTVFLDSLNVRKMLLCYMSMLIDKFLLYKMFVF